MERDRKLLRVKKGTIISYESLTITKQHRINKKLLRMKELNKIYHTEESVSGIKEIIEKKPLPSLAMTEFT
jgi:hypothetical protein